MTEKKLAYASYNPGEIKLSTAIPGLMLDFNYGLRIKVPHGDYHIKFTDSDTDSVLYDADASDVMVTSSKKILH